MTDAALDLLIESAAVAGQIAAGVDRAVVAARTTNRRLALVATATGHKRRRGAEWTEAEDAVIRAHWGEWSNEQIGRALGRSAAAVRIRVKRELRLPAPSKAERILTLEQVAMGFGKDSHYTARLVDRGFLPARELPFTLNGRQTRRVRVIERAAVAAFVVNPMHWMMLDVAKLGLSPTRTQCGAPKWWARLRQLAVRRRALWADEWWTTRQVAEHNHVSVSAVNEACRLGNLPAVRWGNWYVLRSDSTRPGLHLVSWTGKGGAGQDHLYTSARADAFLVLAAAVGLPNIAIGAMMKRSDHWCEYRLRCLRRRGRLAWIVKHNRLPVQLNRRGDLLADWKQFRRRFPRLARAMFRLRRREALTNAERSMVRGVLSAWSHYHARTKAQQAIVRSCKNVGVRQVEHFYRLYQRLRATGVDPYRKLAAS